jgi:hypothetical protein
MREAGDLAGSLARLLRRPTHLPVGSFVFVVSDFLGPVDVRLWLALRARRWDVIPVVVQDPVWEQSFPAVGWIAVPYVSACGGEVHEAWLSRSATSRRRADHERRYAAILARFRACGFDPVVLGDADPDAVLARFLEWAERRRRLRRRVA